MWHYTALNCADLLLGQCSTALYNLDLTSSQVTKTEPVKQKMSVTLKTAAKDFQVENVQKQSKAYLVI